MKKRFSSFENRREKLFLIKSAALELAPYGIRVIALAPSVVDTPIVQFYKDQELLEVMKSKVMGGEITKPELIPNAIYLVSLDEATAINRSVVWLIKVSLHLNKNPASKDYVKRCKALKCKD